MLPLTFREAGTEKPAGSSGLEINAGEPFGAGACAPAALFVFVVMRARLRAVALRLLGGLLLEDQGSFFVVHGALPHSFRTIVEEFTMKGGNQSNRLL